MEIILVKSFTKEYAVLQAGIKEKFKARKELFLNDPFHDLLNNHSVDKAYPGCRSINITGDFRVIYKQSTETKALFLHIGTHSQLYG